MEEQGLWRTSVIARAKVESYWLVMCRALTREIQKGAAFREACPAMMYSTTGMIRIVTISFHES